jgi:tetratricopeptide (TPR) repeat protein
MQKVSFGPIWDHIQQVRQQKGFQPAIDLANEYLMKDPENVEAYLQLMDMYYLMGELEKAEKPVDFLLKRKILNEYVKEDVLYYIKALLLAERTQWLEAKDFIKKAIKSDPNNIEYKRVLAMVEFWS